MGTAWAYEGKKERSHTGKDISSEHWTRVLVVVQFKNTKSHSMPKYPQIRTLLPTSCGTLGKFLKLLDFRFFTYKLILSTS